MKSFLLLSDSSLAAVYDYCILKGVARLIALFLCLSFALLFSSAAFAGVAVKTPSIGETFVGERLTYDIGFWFFERVARAELTLEQEKGGYRAILTARTTGFVDSMIQHREDKYVAHLKEARGKGRFITTSFESSSNVNGKVRHSTKEIVKLRGVLKKHSWGGGKEEKIEEVRLPLNSYVDDPLGAFYNFRYGVYGPVRVGARLSINTFPSVDYKRQKMTMVFRKGEIKEQKKVSALGRVATGKETYIARVRMSKDVFGTDLTDIEIFFSTALIPLKATARDIVIFTDVRGTLVDVSR